MLGINYVELIYIGLMILHKHNMVINLTHLDQKFIQKNIHPRYLNIDLKVAHSLCWPFSIM